MDETTSRPYNQTLLDMYSDGSPYGFGIGVGGERWREQRKFAIKALNDLSEGKSGLLHFLKFMFGDVSANFSKRELNRCGRFSSADQSKLFVKKYLF